MWVKVKDIENGLEITYNNARLEFNECKLQLESEGRTVRFKHLPKQYFAEFYSNKYCLPLDIVTRKLEEVSNEKE